MIGVFDSGFGGLTVLEALLGELPQYDFIYLGDSARAPYGGRSQEMIYNYTKEAVDFLFTQGCVLVILACNTASARALRKIQSEYLPARYPGRNVLGVIRPLAEAAAGGKGIKNIGVIGTRATIESRAYEQELNKLNPRLKVISQSAPLLVPLVEEGWQDKPEARQILKKYLRPLKAKQLDALLLGCTHYPVFYDAICRIMPKRCQIYHPGKIIAASLKNYLERHKEYEIMISAEPKRIFFTTDSPAHFRNLAKKVSKIEIVDIKKADLKNQRIYN